jgi:membrane fusion protein (multidrug efflux system)
MYKNARLTALLIIVCLSTLLGACSKKPAALAPATPVVTVVTIQAEDVPLNIRMIGRITSNRSVPIVARVSGVLLEKTFLTGAVVKEGDVLFRIDPSEYQANLDSALARLSQANAALAKADYDLERTTTLFKSETLSQQNLDDARINQQTAASNVKVAQAAVTIARIQLGYTTIKAPFSGRLGLDTIEAGGIASPSLGTLVTIDQIDPIDIEFTASESWILEMRADISAGKIVTPGLHNLSVTASLLDGSTYEETGVFNSADVRFRPETGTVLAKATFPNAKGKLLPGQFARVSIMGLTRKNAVLVPQTAVVQSPTGASVMVVNADNFAESRTVVLGEWSGDRWHIMSGLKVGDRVITIGLQKVRAGAKVQPAELSKQS